MPIFMPIGPKLWELEGYIQTSKQTDKSSCFNYIDVGQLNRIPLQRFGSLSVRNFKKSWKVKWLKQLHGELM